MARASTLFESDRSYDRRYWRDIKLPALALSLATAPFLPALAGVITLAVTFGFPSVGRFFDGLVFLYCSAACWFVMCGYAHLSIFVRRRGYISRLECLLFGVIAAFLLPFAAVPVGYIYFGLPSALDAQGWSITLRLLFQDLQQSAIAGLCCMPFGLAAGWFYWERGIRSIHSTAEPEERTAAVFE